MRLLGPAAVRRVMSPPEMVEWTIRQIPVRNKSGKLGMLAATVSSGRPEISFEEISIPFRGRPNPRTASCDGVPRCGALLQLGDDLPQVVTDGFTSRLRNHPSEFEMVDIAKSIISAVAKLKDETVGGPIDTLVLDKRGSHWVSVKANCE